MFDTYMDAHALDPQMRRRMSLALGAALVASAVAVVGYASAERLQITRVGAPNVELDFLMAETVASPMAAPPPPAPAEQTPATTESTADPEDPPREDKPTDYLDPTPRTSSTSTVATRGKAGIEGGIPGLPMSPTIGVPCLGGNCKVLPPIKPPPIQATPTKSPPKEPFDRVRARAIFSPDPEQRDLLATPAGISRRGGTSVVEFCVGEDGKIDKATTKRSAGDGSVDRICRDTVKRWRFRPMLVDGRPARTCSEVSFAISFE